MAGTEQDRQAFIDSVYHTYDTAEFAGWYDVGAQASFDDQHADFYLYGDARHMDIVCNIEEAILSAVGGDTPAGEVRVGLVTDDDLPMHHVRRGIREAVQVEYAGRWSPDIAGEFQVALLGLAGVLPTTSDNVNS